MVETNKLESIFEALELIKNGEIVVTKNNNVTTFFALKGKRIHCQSQNLSFNLSFKEFSNLYGQSTFYLYAPSENIIDTKKDDEYYNWNYLKK